MVRVLHVFRIMNPGGAETLMMNIYRKIDRTKIQFDFLCMDANKGAYDDEISKLGGKIYRISSPKKVSVFKHIAEIKKVIKKNGPFAAVHCHTSLHSGIVCFVAWLAGVKIRISHSHSTFDPKKQSLKRKIYITMMKILIKIFTTNKISCGELAAKFLYGQNIENVLVLNNGIDLQKYKEINQEKIKLLKKDFNICDDEINIGHVGRFAEVKNHKFFINLANYMREKKVKFKIILVGDGELRKNVMEEVKRQKLEDFFVFTGLRDDVYNVMKTFDVFVMPSLYEGFPVAIVEALASGKPCVVSDKISKEVEIVDGMVKFVPLDATMESWYENIINVINKKYNIEEISKILDEKGFSSESIAKQLEKIYLSKEKS